jgi:hypothetical protein
MLSDTTIKLLKLFILSQKAACLLYSFVFLKVAKCGIFDRSDFPDFYTIKSLCEGDFGVKMQKILQIFRGSFRGAKFLTRMLSLFLRRLFFEVWAKKFFLCGTFKTIS